MTIPNEAKFIATTNVIPPMTAQDIRIDSDAQSVAAQSNANMQSVEQKNPKPKLKPKAKPENLSKYRWMIFGRFVLAIFGGYAFSALVSMCIANAFPEMRASAVLSATMLAFVVHCAVFIWVFLVNSTIKAWLGVLIPCVVFFLLNQWLKG